MQRSLPRNDAILASSRCGMAVVAPQGEWLVANPALCRLLGEPAEALVGGAAHRRLFPADAARIDAALRGLADGPAGLDVAYRHPQGAALRLEIDVDALPAEGGAEPLALLQVRDATAVHRAQAQREAADRQQEHFAFGISHDLRASLRGIEGFAAQLERQPLDEHGREYLGRIRTAAAQAGSLVDALVQLSRASTIAQADAPVDLSLLAAWTLAELQDAEPGRAVALEIQPNLTVRGDEHQLKRMLQQLLHNAWKFSSGRERVEIAVEGRPTAHGTLVVCIRDNGSGFDMRYADKLFTPFRRLHGPDHGGGHGLGLAIARAIAERHGGRTWAESPSAAGSRFFVELPAIDAGSEP